MSNFRLGNRSLSRLDGVSPEIVKLTKLAITMSKVDFGIPRDGGLRTTQDQQRLFKEGKSKADGVKHFSAHQLGDAVDFYAYVDGDASWNKQYLAEIACAFFKAATRLDIQIAWGGSFSWYDGGHIEIL